MLAPTASQPAHSVLVVLCSLHESARMLAGRRSDAPLKHAMEAQKNALHELPRAEKNHHWWADLYRRRQGSCRS